MTRCLAIAFLAVFTSVAASATHLPPPTDLADRVTFEQRLGQPLPMDAPILDADGKPTTLGKAMNGKPLLLAFGYYRCPNLCDLTLHGMARAVASMSLRPGDDYAVLFLSIAADESAKDASDAKSMLAQMEAGAHVDRWHFAVAGEPAVKTLTAAAGFRYFLDPRNGQYAHPAGVVVVTPEGRIAQYFYGVNYDARSLSLALINASHGQLGSVIDQIVLFCCGYDPATGRYSLLISRLMMGLGCGFVLAMLAGGWHLRRRRT